MRETEEMEQRDRCLGGVRTSCALREMVGLGEVGGERRRAGWLKGKGLKEINEPTQSTSRGETRCHSV
jgi:hypothetical protein